MLTASKLSAYLDTNSVVWIPTMPDGVPPEDILIPQDHILYRLTKGETFTKDDLITYYEMKPNNEWGDNLSMSLALSMYDDLSKTEKLVKLPALKNSKGVSKFVLNPKDGVVLQTTKKTYHYSWWRTDNIDIESVEMVRRL